MLASTESESLKVNAEIESLKATNEEFKKVIASTRLRYQVEREARDDLHSDTIKVTLIFMYWVSYIYMYICTIGGGQVKVGKFDINW